jgi:hypothetical protein
MDLLETLVLSSDQVKIPVGVGEVVHVLCGVVWLGWTSGLMLVGNDYLETRLSPQSFAYTYRAFVAGIFSWPVDCGVEPCEEE